MSTDVTPLVGAVRTKRGVTSHTPEGVDCYQRLVHPTDSIETRRKLADDLFSLLLRLLRDECGAVRKTWRILDAGIGGGWLTALLLSRVFAHEGDGPTTIELVGIDTSPAMLSRLYRELAAAMPDGPLTYAPSLPAPPEWGAEAVPTSFEIEDAGCRRRIRVELIQKSLSEYGPTATEPFDVCLLFLLLHHLDDWNEGIAQSRELVRTGGMVVISEMGGDHACWSHSFEEVEDLHTLHEEDERLKYLSFIRRALQDFADRGWRTYRPVTAARVAPAVERLQELGFRLCPPPAGEGPRRDDSLRPIPSLCVEYSTRIKPDDWLEAAALRIFSIFPYHEQDSKQRKKGSADAKSVNSGLRRTLQKLAGGLNLNAELTVKDRLKLYVLHHRLPCGEADTSDSPGVTPAASVDIRRLFMDVRVPTRHNSKEQFRVWKGDTKSLLNYGAIRNPAAVLFLQWDLVTGNWTRNVPVFFQDRDASRRLLLYYALSLQFVEGFKVTNFLFRELPDKACVVVKRLNGRAEASAPLTVRLRRDGSVEQLTVTLPDTILNPTFRIWLEDAATPLLARAVRELRFQKEFEYGQYLSINNQDLEEVSSQLRTWLFNDAPGESSEPFTDELDRILKDFQRVFASLAVFRRNDGWNLDDELVIKLIKVLTFNAFVARDIPEVRLYASRDSLEQDKEVSAGGLIVHVTDNTRIDDALLAELLTLRNRASYLQQHTQKTHEQSRKFAVAAIMSRNLSHNLGSHVTPRSTLEAIHRRLGGTAGIEHFNVASQLKRRLDYLIQRKGDFLAELTTEPLTTTRSALFYREVMLSLIQNTLLSDNLARNEGVGYRVNHEGVVIDGTPCGLQFHVSIRGTELGVTYEDSGAGEGEVATFTYPTTIPYTFPYGSLQAAAEPGDKRWLRPVMHQRVDVEVALPGAQGDLAVYGLLENFVRNVAKHHKTQLLAQGAEATIEVRLHVDPPGVDEDPDHHTVELTTNLWDASTDRELYRYLRVFQERFDKIRNEDLIEENGSLKKANWGLAEMRICANLLRGSDTNSQKGLKDALTLVLGKDRILRYRFKMLRAQLVCIVAPEAAGVMDETPRNLLHLRGIWIFDSLSSLQKHLAKHASRFKFALIQVHPSMGDLETLEPLLSQLPFRVLITGADAAGIAPIRALHERGRAVVAETLDEIIQTLFRNASDPLEVSKFTSALWRTWVTKRFLRDGENPERVLLLLHLELRAQGTDPHASEKGWSRAVFDFPVRDNPVEFRTTPPPDVCGRRLVIYDRHGTGGEGVVRSFLNCSRQDDESMPPLLQQRHAYMVLDKASADFVPIFSPTFPDENEPEAMRQHWPLPWQMVEAGLLRVIVIDERLAEHASERVNDNDSENLRKVYSYISGAEAPPTRLEVAGAANVFICTHLRVNDKEEPLYAIGGTAPAARETSASSLSPPRRFVVSRARDGAVRSHWITGADTQYVDVQAEMVIIHQGILDGVHRLFGVEAPTFLKNICDAVPYVVVDSGRGIPRSDSDVKFIPYSLVQHYIQDQISKLSLTSAIMALGRRPRGEF
ncbi:MAG TPA: class I SAM-dependent methyltransferase [Longimicrobium sp.]